jgi:hypothetical protein
MDNLSIPGFTAESSVYRSGAHYRGAMGLSQNAEISPQLADLLTSGSVGHVTCGPCNRRGERICCDFRGCWIELCFPP